MVCLDKSQVVHILATRMNRQYCFEKATKHQHFLHLGLDPGDEVRRASPSPTVHREPLPELRKVAPQGFLDHQQKQDQ